MRIELLYKKIILLVFFNNFLLSAQQTEDYYIKKIGFEKHTILKNRDTINYISTPISKNNKKPTILFLQGSTALPIIFHDDKEAQSIIPFKLEPYLNLFNFVVIQRKGIPIVGTFEKDSHGVVDQKGNQPIEYIKYDNLNYRSFQAENVLKDIKRLSNIVFLVGHSEGYRVAARVAERNSSKINKLVCISADPFNRTTEEITKARLQCLNSNDDTLYQQEVDIAIKDFKNIGKNIEDYKNDYDLYNWASYNNKLTFKSFEKFNNPILVVYGSDDIPALHNDLLPFLLPEKKITLKVYPDCDHNFFKKKYDNQGSLIEETYHWDDVFKDIAKWLLN